MEGSTPESVVSLRFMDGSQKGAFSWMETPDNMKIPCLIEESKMGILHPKMKQMGIIYSKRLFNHFFTVFHHFFTGGGHFFTEYR